MGKLEVKQRFLTVLGVSIPNTHVGQGSLVFVSKTDGGKKIRRMEIGFDGMFVTLNMKKISEGDLLLKGS